MANPFRAGGFVARCPRLRRGVVSLGISQFEAGASPVGLLRPTARIGIFHEVGGIAGRINEHQSFPGVGEFPFEGTDNLSARIFRAKEPWIFSDEQQLSCFQRRAGGEPEADALGEIPARQVDIGGAAVEELHPAARNRSVGRVIEDFVEDHLAVKTHLVGLSRTQCGWESPGTGAIGMASLGLGAEHHGIQHALVGRGFQDEVVAPLRSEA